MPRAEFNSWSAPSIQDAISALPEFLQRFAPPFPVGYSSNPEVMAYLQANAARPLYVPHMVFLDRAGVIRADFPAEDSFFQNANANIRAQLDKMLRRLARRNPWRSNNTDQLRATLSAYFAAILISVT